MNAGLFAQYVMNGLMLGMMYALVAVGFTLFSACWTSSSSRTATF
jgi:branched-subunit amino acid ABC-type transport system permease component